MPDLDLPKIGKYEIQADLGQGGFGKVYRAFDPTVGRPVAIKILTVEGNQDLLTRFRNEATAAGKLKHRNIVTIYEFGEYNGRPYLVMELLEGQDLVQVIKDGVKLSLLQKMNIMDQVADGLDCAHRNGIIHRDIKPGNIRLLPDGTVKIMDFGVARMNREQEETRLTQQGDLIGTILYMSPEQFSGGVADALSDIFAYGVTYYELLTGEHPFKSTDPGRVMFKISMEDPQPLRLLVPECPESLEQIINRAIQKDREMRYQGLRDLRVDTEPLMFELEQERARTLEVDAQRLSDAGDFNSALAIIHEALELDPGNRAVRQLRETIQRELQKQALHSRLQVMLQTAEEQLARREFAPAVQTLESALKLDQTNEPARASLEAARADLQRYKDSARMAAAAFGDLRRKDFAGAYEKAAEAARLDPLNKDALHTLAEARKHIAVMDRLREIDVFRTQGDFDSALSDLRNLASRHPDSREVQKFLEETVARQAAASRIAAASKQAREYIDQSRFGDAVEWLSSALRDFPEEPGMLALLAEAKVGLEAQHRIQAIQEAVRTAESLKDAADFDGALHELDRTLALFPGESRLTELSSAVRSAQSARERDLFVNGIVQQGADLRANLQFSEALDTVQAGLRRYNQDPTLLRLEAELQTACERQQHADAAQRSMEAGRFQEAVEGLEKASSRDPEATELQSLLSHAKVELEAQKKNQAIERVARQAEVRTKREDFKGALQILEKALDSWPREARILELIQSTKEAAQQQLERQQRAKAVARLVQEGQRLLGQSQTDPALELLEKACDEYPEASELGALLAQARERREGVERAEREARVYFDQREFDPALQILEQALELWPGEGRLAKLIEDTRTAHAAYEREQAIEEIVREAKLLDRDGRYDHALRVVQQGLRTYERAPALTQLEREILARLQREQRAAAIAQSIEEGQKLLAQGQSLRALEALEKSSRQYSESGELQNLLEQARQRQAGIAQAEREAQRWAGPGDPNRALQILEKALESWPGEARLLELLQTTQEAAQQRARAVSAVVEECNQLRTSQRFAEALAAVRSGLQKYAGEPVLIQLEQELREQLERQQRAETVAGLVQDAQRLLGLNQTARALEILERACAEYPEASELQPLLAQARERKDGLERAEREAQVYAERGDFNQALQLLEKALELWPGEGRLEDLLQTTRAARAAHEREQAIEKIARETKRFRANQRFDDALLIVQEGLRTYQREPALVQLEQEILAQLQRQQRAEAIAQRVEEGRLLLSQGQSLQAVEALEKSSGKYPEVVELQNLLRQARERQADVARVAREAQGWVDRGDLNRGLQILEQALKSWPGEARILELLQRTQEGAQQRARAVSALVDESNQLRMNQRLADALAVVQSGLQEYPGEPALIQIEQELRAEVERQQRAEAVARLVQEGQRLLGQNQTARALEMLDKACAEYPEASELQALLAQARERWGGIERAAREAQVYADRLDFNRASQILEEALQLWPGEGRLAELIQAIRAARAAYEREQAIEAIVREAKRLEANQQYDDALRTIREGLRSYQRAPVLMQLEQEIQAELQRQQRAAAIAQSIEEGQGLLSQGQSLRAVKALEKNSRQYPEAGELQALLKQARQRQEGVAQAEREAQRGLERKNFAKVVEILNKAVQSWPTEVRLQELLQTATADLAAQERERAVVTLAREIDQLAGKRSFPEALAAVRAALQTYGQDPRLVQLERQVLEQQKRSQPELYHPTAPVASVQAPSVPRSRLLLIGVGSVALLAAGFIGLRAFRSNGGVALKLSSNVAGASIVVGDKSCVMPDCSLALPAGTYHLTAAKDGYQTLNQTIAVSKSTAEFSLVLQPLPQMVQVNTNFPSGQVFLDGHQAGPLSDGQFFLSGVSPGAHTLRVTSGTAQFETEWQTATGDLPQLQRPFTAKNVQAIVIANLGRNGSILCDCDARAIKVDGNAVSATKTRAQGIQLTNLQEGTRRISIGDRSLLVDLKPNPALNVFLALDRDMGTLVIDANESGAKIYIDDRPYHRLTDRGLRIPLDVGRYTIRVEKDGFRSSSPQTIDLAKSEDKQMAFVLEPIPPALAISSALPEAQVKVDGRAVGQTDSSGSFRAEVTAGNHLVELTKQDYTDVRLNLGFAPGRTVRPDRSQIAMSRVVKAPPVAAPATATIESKAPESKPTDGQDWDRVRNSSNPDDLEDFIRKHPGSANINDARNRLAQLRSQMDAAAARQAEQTAWNRLDKTNKADLQDFLSRYGAGAHAPDARTLIGGIDKQEADKEKEQEQANRALADYQSIARTLSAYEAAYNAKDLKAIQSVWQELPKNMAEATRREFGDAKSIGFQIRAIDKPMVNGDSATVNCDRTLSLTLKQGGRQQMPGERVRVALTRASSGWLIQSITPY